MSEVVTRQVAALTDAYHQLLAEPSVGVHDLRVAMRRLRSTLLVFAAKSPYGQVAYELRDAAAELSRLRDLEVIEERLATHSGEDKEALRHELDRLRRSAGTAAQMLGSPRFAAVFADLADLASHPFPSPPPRTVQEKLRKELLRASGRLRDAVGGPDEHRDERLHEARKAVKRARYILEGFGHLDEDQAAVVALVEAQDDLGLWHDTVVQRHLIGEGEPHTPEQWAEMSGRITEFLDRLEPAISVRSPS